MEKQTICADCKHRQKVVHKAGIPLFRVVVREDHLCHAREKTDPVTGPIPQTPRDCYKVREKYPTKCPMWVPDVSGYC